LRRGVDFWSRVAPIGARYLWAAKTLEGEAKAARYKELHEKYAPAAYDLVVDLRGLYVKGAQVFSVRPEFLPPEYREQFAKCQNAMPPADALDVWGALRAELGERADMFVSVEETACGAASIGQAHKAVMKRPDGTTQPVVVKIQYPTAELLFDMDFGCIRTLLWFIAQDALPFWDGIRDQFATEFDYSREARNLSEVGDAVNARFGDKVVVPSLIPEMCSPKVITMTYVPGEKLEDVVKAHLRSLGVDLSKGVGDWIKTQVQPPEAENRTMAPSPSQDPRGLAPTASEAGYGAAPGKRWALPGWLRGIVASDAFLALLRALRPVWRWIKRTPANDMEHLLRSPQKLLHDLFEVHGFEILLGGLYNGDPHPGNILLCPDGRIGLIDYGQCDRSTPEMRKQLARLLRGIADPKYETEVAPAFRALGLKTKNDDPEFIATMARLIFGRMSAEILDHDFHHKLHKTDRIEKFPKDLVMVYRAAVLLRGLGLSLQYNISPAESWSKFAAEVLEEAPCPA